jgi:peptidoglycan hydrolase CwlO-like protein
VAIHEDIDLPEFLIKCGRGMALYQMLDSGPDEQVVRYNNILEYNANLQKRIKELLNSNEELSRQLDARDTEVTNLKKAPEINTGAGSP